MNEADAPPPPQLEPMVIPDKDSADLSPEQKQAMEEGPGWVTDRLAMAQFPDATTFWGPQNSNNFHIFFDTDNLYAAGYRAQLAFQRFAILFPNRLHKLENEMESARVTVEQGNPKTVLEMKELGGNEEFQREFFEAYQLMSQLVDRADIQKNPSLLRSDGEVNERALLG